MENFINYQTFSNLQEASELIDLLNTNQIPFEIDDSAMRFDIAAKNINPLEDGIIIKIRETDKEKINEISSKNKKTDSIYDYYLYSFSDNDIIDIIVNPEEWTEEEIALAKKISKERNLKPTAEQVKLLRKNTDKVKEQIKQENLIKNNASWFLFIAIMSIANTILILSNQNFHFAIGLGISELILVVMYYGVQQATGIDLTVVSFILTLLVPAFFIWVWAKSKKKNQNVYLAGAIVYGVDTLISVFFKLWIGVAVHLLCLWFIFMGYKTLTESNKNNKLEDKSV